VGRFLSGAGRFAAFAALALCVSLGCRGGTNAGGASGQSSHALPEPTVRDQHAQSPHHERALPAHSPPPADDDLLDITEVVPSVVVDIRYATTNNFTGVAVYPVARCLLRRSVARRIARVQTELRKRGLGLALWDCYRPISVQRRFWKLVPDRRYVARVVFENGRPIEGSKHNRGAAVDATLVDATGHELEMPTGYDDFTSAAHRDYERSSPAARSHMKTLEEHMVAQGFVPLATEWWHFDAPDWESYPLSDEPLR